MQKLLQSLYRGLGGPGGLAPGYLSALIPGWSAWLSSQPHCPAAGAHARQPASASGLCFPLLRPGRLFSQIHTGPLPSPSKCWPRGQLLSKAFPDSFKLCPAHLPSFAPALPSLSPVFFLPRVISTLLHVIDFILIIFAGKLKEFLSLVLTAVSHMPRSVPGAHYLLNR